MTRRLERMLEDQRLRDAARALVEADVEHLKTDLRVRGLGARALDRIAEGASDVYDEAVDVAEDHKGVLTALIAAVFIWFARNPILSLFDRDEDDAEPDEEDAMYNAEHG